MPFIHSNLRVLMAERGLNIQNIKDNTTLSRTTISNLVNNYGSGIQFDTLVQLCSLLNCSPGDLLTYVDVTFEFSEERDNQTFNAEYETYVEDPSEGYGEEYLCRITTNISILCKMIYEKEIFQFKIPCNVQVELDHRCNIVKLNADTSDAFQVNIKKHKLTMPIYVAEHFLEQLHIYIEELVPLWVSKI
ncbi:helix-turn-helix transcriptional regulator [Lysinibacillus sp. KU-BSD001]|uniref:helix-turn-helix domain-containing protein n=1 Tax=Lysinibacillus sp. KU-BSD001 TaxID=3141328 RepID=UPI0036F09FBA